MVAASSNAGGTPVRARDRRAVHLDVGARAVATLPGDDELERAERLERNLLHGNPLRRIGARAQLNADARRARPPAPAPAPAATAAPADVAAPVAEAAPVAIPVPAERPGAGLRRCGDRPRIKELRVGADGTTSRDAPRPRTSTGPIEPMRTPAPTAHGRHRRAGGRRGPQPTGAERRSVVPPPICSPMPEPVVVAAALGGAVVAPAAAVVDLVAVEPAADLASVAVEPAVTPPAPPAQVAPPAPPAPAALTAGRLTQERRRAGVALYDPANGSLADDECAWEEWAEGLRDTDERMAQLTADLGGHTSRLSQVASRIFASRHEVAPPD